MSFVEAYLNGNYIKQKAWLHYYVYTENHAIKVKDLIANDWEIKPGNEKKEAN